MKRPRFQFRLTALLGLTLAIAAGLRIYQTCYQPFLGQERAAWKLRSRGATVITESAPLPFPFYYLNRDTHHVVEVHLGQPFFDDTDLALLAEFPQLRALLMSSPNVSDQGLRSLARLRHLRTLDFGYQSSSITSAGLQHVGQIQSLEELSLWGTSVDDAGLEQLSNLSNLRSLSLAQTKVLGPGLHELRKLSNLNKLSLQATKLGDEDLVHLSSLTQIETLSLANTNVTGKGLVHLGLANLKSLDLTASKFTDADADNLLCLRALEQLSLRNTKATVDVLEVATCLQRLKSIDLRNTSVSRRVLPAHQLRFEVILWP